MRVFVAISCGVLLFTACDAATKTPAATPEALSAPAGFVFNSAVSLVVGAADDSKAPCGLASAVKIGGQVDPGVDQRDGTWAISGCFYSHGNELWNPQIVLTFPREGQGEAREIVVVPARPYVAKDHREVPFGTTVRRANVSGMRAYLVTYVR